MLLFYTRWKRHAQKARLFYNLFWRKFCPCKWKDIAITLKGKPVKEVLSSMWVDFWGHRSTQHWQNDSQTLRLLIYIVPGIWNAEVYSGSVKVNIRSFALVVNVLHAITLFECLVNFCSQQRAEKMVISWFGWLDGISNSRNFEFPANFWSD